MTESSARFENLPAPGPFRDDDVIRDLGDGLLLRHATPADADAVVAFNETVHANPPDFPPERYVANWTRDLIGGGHPRLGPRDFTLVEDTQRARIASTLCLIPHRFRYGGVELDAGQPEIVGTHPDYRRRGLVAAQFDEIHRWSEARGQLVQVIDGIPWYYRQFGYEMGIESGAGRIAYRANFPSQAPEGDLRVRLAEERDVRFVAAAWRRASERELLSCVHDEDFCHYAMFGRHPLSTRGRVFRIVESAEGEPLALFVHLPILLFGGMLFVERFEVADGVPWQTVVPWVFEGLKSGAEEIVKRDGGELTGAVFRLGSEHPLYTVAKSRLPEERLPYAWYVRVPDLGRFLLHVAPALERRLAGSELAGHSGAIELSFYRSGLKLVLDKGRLAGIEPFRPSTERRGDLAFPDLTFLQVVFGLRTVDEQYRTFADCQALPGTGRAVVEAMFPKQTSNLLLTD